MKTIFLPVLALAGTSVLGLAAVAEPDGRPDLTLVGSSDGAGLPGLPGGRGGKSGRELAREEAARGHRRATRADDDDSDDFDPKLAEYCVAVLRNESRPRGSDFRPMDCADLFRTLDADRRARSRDDTGRRGADGRDGASIAGGRGGAGGRAGTGAGAGSGGGGGAGVAGGSGGAGGRGGSSD